MSETQPSRHRRPGRRSLVIAALAGVLVAAVAFPAGAWALGWWGDGPTSTSSPGTPPTGTSVTAGTSASPSSSAPAPASASAAAAASPSASAKKAAAKATGPCGRKRTTTPTTRITSVTLGSKVVGYGGEGDTEKLPMAIAATPDGGSWLAWLGTDNKVHLGKLGCDDKLIGKPTTFTGIDLQDVQADANGGVLLLTRKGTCGTGPLCGGESSPCNTMHMVRFDNDGKLVWERQVTNGRDGYTDGARFVWWYQHHGRLATDGSNYAAYFGVAITVKNGNCVDIHQGDRMQVVTAGGKLRSGGFEVGCSHAWNPRIVWDPRTKKFVTVCATDNNCRIAQPSPYRTVAKGTCDGTLFGGDLVLAKAKGYWTAWSQGGKVRLAHFAGSAAADKNVTTAASSKHPHLVAYGPGRMLLTWQSGASMRAQVYDSGTASTVGKQFTIAVKDHDYQAFKPYADGSAAYPAAGASSGSIRIARVMPS